MNKPVLNEFRQDLVSGEWVLFATGRAKRPSAERPAPEVAPAFGNAGTKRPVADIAISAGETSETKGRQADNFGTGTCPFEDLAGHGNEIVATYACGDEPDFITVIKNKFPAVIETEGIVAGSVGPINTLLANGAHEIVVYRRHERELWDFTPVQWEQVVRVFQERYQALTSDPDCRYLLIFHNRGVRAGASLAHPHTQIISLPLVPPDIRASLTGAVNFYQQNKQRVYDRLLQWEQLVGQRIIRQTQNFVALCPFVSRLPYEVRIFPLAGGASFADCPAEQLAELGELCGAVLKTFQQILNAPDFNFFIHSVPAGASPVEQQAYSWHIELAPKTGVWGGLELGSGVTVNIIDPDQAAEELRNAL